MNFEPALQAAAEHFDSDRAELIRRAVEAGALNTLEHTLSETIYAFTAERGSGDALATFRSQAAALRAAAIRSGDAATFERVRADEAALLRVSKNLRHLGESRAEQERNADMLQAVLDGATEVAIRLLPILIAGA